MGDGASEPGVRARYCSHPRYGLDGHRANTPSDEAELSGS